MLSTSERSIASLARRRAARRPVASRARTSVPRPASGNNGDLDDQVQYVAMYNREGRLLYASANLGARRPSLTTLGWQTDPHSPHASLGVDVQ